VNWRRGTSPPHSDQHPFVMSWRQAWLVADSMHCGFVSPCSQRPPDGYGYSPYHVDAAKIWKASGNRDRLLSILKRLMYFSAAAIAAESLSSGTPMKMS